MDMPTTFTFVVQNLPLCTLQSAGWRSPGVFCDKSRTHHHDYAWIPMCGRKCINISSLINRVYFGTLIMSRFGNFSRVWAITNPWIIITRLSQHKRDPGHVFINQSEAPIIVILTNKRLGQLLFGPIRGSDNWPIRGLDNCYSDRPEAEIILVSELKLISRLSRV